MTQFVIAETGAGFSSELCKLVLIESISMFLLCGFLIRWKWAQFAQCFWNSKITIVKIIHKFTINVKRKVR